MEKNRIGTLVLLIIILAFGAFRFFSILWADQVPPIHDPMEMRHLSRLLYEGFAGHRDGFPSFFEQIAGSAYPPLIHFTAQPFLFALGTARGAESSFVLYLAILLLASYGIGNRIAGRRAGILAALIVLFTPMLDSFSRIYMVDYPLASVTTLTVYLLIKSDGFARRGSSILLGLSFCAGMFIKQTFVVYVGLPIVFCLLVRIAHTPKVKMNLLLINFAIFGILAAPLPVIYFLPDFTASLQQRTQVDAFFSSIDRESYRIWPYLLILGQRALGPVIALGALFGLFRNVRRRQTWLLAIWALPPILMIDAVQTMESPRYLLPLLPAFGLLFAVGLESILNRLPGRAARMFSGMTVLLVLAAFAVSTLENRGKRFDFEDFHLRFQERGMARPGKIDWSCDPAVERIIGSGSIRKVVFLFNSPYSECLQGALWEIDPFAEVDTPIEKLSLGVVPPEMKTPEWIAGYFDATHWVALHSNYRQDLSVINYSHPLNPKNVDPILDRFFEVKHQFELAGRYDIPDTEGLVLLYERTATPGTALEKPADITTPGK